MIFQRATVTHKHIINETYFKLGISLKQPYRSVLPGQFVMLKNLEDNTTFLPRPFGIYGIAAGGDALELLIKVLGKGTKNLFGIKEGAAVSVLGPLGNGFDIGADKRRLILVAGGIGIAPFNLLAARAKNDNACGLKLLYGGKSAADKEIISDFEESGIEIACASEDGSFGKKGLVTALLCDEIQSISDKDETLILACGPEPMLRAVALQTNAGGIDCRLSFESSMACGIGTCHGCVIPVRGEDGALDYKRVCREGPVFDAKYFYFDE